MYTKTNLNGSMHSCRHLEYDRPRMQFFISICSQCPRYFWNTCNLRIPGFFLKEVLELFPVAVEKMFVKLHFYLMINYRKHFGNEELQKETEFNLCIKPERSLAGPEAWHISAFPFVYKCLVKWLLLNRLIVNGFGTSISRSYPFLHLCTVWWHLISFPIGKWLIVDNFNLHTVCT